MNSFLHSDACLRLAGMLVHSTWILTLICGAALIVMRAVRPQMRAAWWIGFSSLVCGALVAAGWFVWAPVPDGPESENRLASESAVTGAAVAASPDSIMAARGDAEPVSGDRAAVAESSGRNTANEMVAARAVPVTPDADSRRSAREPSVALYIVWLTPAWICGVLFMTLRWCWGMRLAHRLLSHASPCTLPLFDQFERLCGRMALGRRIRLLVSSQISTPMVVGLFRSAIIIPASLISQLTPDQWDAILAHELSHIRRHDAILNLVQIFIETIFFYHPFVWLLSREVRLARECCCDRMAAEATGLPAALAEALFLIEKSRSTILRTEQEQQLASLVAAVGDGQENSTLTRIRLLLVPPVNSHHRAWSAGTVAVLGLSTILLAGWFISAAGIAAQQVGADDQARFTSEPRATGPAQGKETSSAVSGGEPQPWEVSKLYDAATLRYRYLMHEAPPMPIRVPAVRGRVFRPDGRPLSNAVVASHTPRQWLRLQVPMILEDQHRRTDAKGRFGMPARGEPYRVLVTDSSGVASLSHEELIHAAGRIQLKPWASVRGSFLLNGQPQIGKKVILRFNTLPWSYSRYGPRLTTEYSTTTDENGEFSIEKVPPLAGVAVIHDESLQRAVRYKCESGKTTTIEFGRGVNVSGVLPKSALEEVSELRPNRCAVNLTPVPLAIPWPRDLGRDEAARKSWKEQWMKTSEGFAFSDENHIRVNTNIYGSLNDAGQFRLVGVPAGLYRLAIRQERTTLVEREVHVEMEDVVVRTEPGLPNLRVRVIDTDRRPVQNALVAVYDRNHARAGLEQDFERFTVTTGPDGWADAGVLPQEYLCVEVIPRRNNLDSSYAVITRSGSFRQTRPPRYNVRLEEKPAERAGGTGTLSMEFTVRQGVDINFDVVDSKTGETAFWSEIYFQDSQKSWWNFALIDGGGQYDVVPVGPDIGKAPLIVTAPGYFSKSFQFAENLTVGRTFEKKILLQKAPRLRLTVVASDGAPAGGARLIWKSLSAGLKSTQVLSDRVDPDGQLLLEFPPGGEYLRMQVVHPAGTATLNVGDLDLRDADPDEPYDVRLELKANR